MRRLRFSLSGLTPQLFLFVVFPLTVLIIILAFGGLYLHQESMRTLVAERDERAVRAATSAIGEQLLHRASAVESLALLTDSETDLSQTLAGSDHLLADFDYGLAFYAPTGERLASRGGEAFWEKMDQSFTAQLADMGKQTSTPIYMQIEHPISGDPVIFVPAKGDDDRLVVVGAFSPEQVARLILADVFAPREQAMAFIITEEGTLLYQAGSFNTGERLEKNTGIQDALDGTRGATYFSIGDNEYVVAYSPIQPTGWTLVIGEPWEAVASSLLRITENAPLIMVPALLLALVALWFGVKQVVQPLKELEEKSAELGWGDYHAIEESVGGIAEIRRLQTELIHMAQKVEASQEGMRGYIGAITTGQEEERRRLARELHDETLQALIALNQRIQLTRLAVDGEEITENSLMEIQELTEQTIQNLRRITRALRPIYLEDLGLVASLEMLAQETQAASEAEVIFHSSGKPRRVNSFKELALYRIAQETLSNVSRHSGASQCHLRLDFSPQLVRLSIHDDGRGFVVPDSPAELARQGHFGLLGMQERAELIGARLSIQSAPMQGTTITVELPTE